MIFCFTVFLRYVDGSITLVNICMILLLVLPATSKRNAGLKSYICSAVLYQLIDTSSADVA